MPRDHGRILVTIWDDPDFLGLTPGAQRLYMLLLSQRGINNAGMIPTQIGKWAKRSRYTDHEDIVAALTELCEARFVACDDFTEETLVRSFIRNDGIVKNANVFKNALACAEGIESPVLRAILADELRRLRRADADDVAARIHPEETPNEAPLNDVGTPFERRSDDVSTPAGKGKGTKVSQFHENPSSLPPRAHTREATSQQTSDAIDTPGKKVDFDGWRLIKGKTDAFPQSTRTALAIEASAMLKQGIPADDIAAGLDRWLTKDLGPSQLPHLVTDIIRAKTRPPAVPGALGDRSQLSNHDRKTLGWAEAAAAAKRSLGITTNPAPIPSTNDRPLLEILSSDIEYPETA
jgi:hypothetical protein